MVTESIQEGIMRRIQVICFAVAVFLAASANSQNLSGSFSTGPLGEKLTIHGNEDGTADIYDQDGRHVGQAEDDGYGHWDIHTTDGRRLGEIQEKGDGSFEVNDANGWPWGSGRVDSVK
jgi:hypothetical protein